MVGLGSCCGSYHSACFSGEDGAVKGGDVDEHCGILGLCEYVVYIVRDGGRCDGLSRKEKKYAYSVRDSWDYAGRLCLWCGAGGLGVSC